MARRIFSKKNALYLCYGLVLFFALAYFRFPAEKVRQYVEWTVDQKLAGYSVHLGGVGVRFPYMVEFTNITLSKTGTENAVPLKVTSLQLSPVFSAPFAEMWRTVELRGVFGEGSFSGRVLFIPETQRFALHNLNGTALPVTPLVAMFLDRKITGSLGLTGVDYEADWAEPYRGTGRGELVLTEGQMALLTPVFAMEALDFKSIAMVYAMDSGLINISVGRCDGKDLWAEFTGNVLAADPLAASGLQLAGDLDFTQEFLAGHEGEDAQIERIKRRFQVETVPFKIGGDLNRPRITFEL